MAILSRFALPLILLAFTCQSVDAQGLMVRIKDLTDVEGVRGNKLVGLGLVTGLNGTGGQNPITRQFAQNFEQNFGQRATAAQRSAIATDALVRTKNLSVVTVTAEVPAFSRPGSRIDVTVGAFDDAKSLQGGTLMPTSLTGVDGESYGLASGRVSIGGFSFGGDAAQVQQNHPTVGRIPNGMTLEEPITTKVGQNGRVRLLLRQADANTAQRITLAINAAHPLSAIAVDPGTVEVGVPGDRLGDINGFLAEIGALRVQPDVTARVIVNERTGTIIIGENVRLGKVAVTHANLSIVTTETPQVSQPAPLGNGDTVVVPRTDIEVTEERRALSVVGATSTVGDLAEALNALGVTPRDLSSIFQQLKQAGALHASLRFE